VLRLISAGLWRDLPTAVRQTFPGVAECVCKVDSKNDTIRGDNCSLGTDTNRPEFCRNRQVSGLPVSL
jgi:hypothetical protein